MAMVPKTKRRDKNMFGTGHRDIPTDDYPELAANILAAVRDAYANGIDTFISGMAMGFDMLFAETVLSLKSELPGIRLVAAIPYKNQPTRWPEDEQVRYKSIINRADFVVDTSNGVYGKKVYFIRDKWMVDNSCTGIAYCTKEGHSGTKTTIKYAEKQCVPIKSVVPDPNHNN